MTPCHSGINHEIEIVVLLSTFECSVFKKFLKSSKKRDLPLKQDSPITKS